MFICFLTLSLAGGWAAAAHAHVVVFAHGSPLEIKAYAIDGDRVLLELPAGGELRVSLLQIERIVEIEEVEEPTPEPPAAAAFDLRFDPAQPFPEKPYGDLIYAAAERHSVNPSLVAAVVRAESAFQARAVSPKGARGLMQLMPATARRFGLVERELFEPARNLDAGVRYLSWLIDRFNGQLPNVLAAYNAGEGTVDRYSGVPPYRETHNYLRRIYAELGLPEVELALNVTAPR